MAGRCVICEGRIVGSRCQDCGMDYSRMAEHRYRLNEDCGAYSPKAREQKREYERTLLGKEEKAAGKGSGGKPVRRTENRAGGYGKGRPAQRKKTKGGGAARKPVSVIKWVVIIWIAIGFVSALVTELPTWFRESGGGAELGADPADTTWEAAGGSEEADVGFDENKAETTKGLYDYVEKEMPVEGEIWSELLTAGFYTVGETIPQGTYRVTVLEGQGSLHVEDLENSIWYYSWLEPENEVEDLRLYPGARVTVEGGCELGFYGENAQTEALIPYVADDTLKEVELSLDDAYLVGTVIAPGRYDVWYKVGEDPGIIEVRVETADGNTHMIFLSDYGPEEGYREVFHNLPLAEGDTLMLEGTAKRGTVCLSPNLEFP